ncbi:MAG: hypothetical protein ACO23H_03250 [Alphaproteobacteria bacterium]
MALQNSFATFFGALYPQTGNVINTAPTYGDAINVLNGTLTTGGTGVIPSPDDVRSGVAVGVTVGNLTLPLPAQVLAGVTFGTNGTQYTGTLVNNVIPYPPASDMIRLKVQISLNGEPVEGAAVTATLCQANSVVVGNVDPSLATEKAVTIGGYTELDLFRQVSFVRGSGEYMIEVKHKGQILASVKAAMPDQAEIFLSELVTLSSPGYTGG